MRQIARLKQQRFLPFTFYKTQISYEKIGIRKTPTRKIPTHQAPPPPTPTGKFPPGKFPPGIFQPMFLNIPTRVFSFFCFFIIITVIIDIT